MKCLFDLDGVYLNVLEGIRKMLSARGYDFNPSAVTSYDFRCEMGCDRKLVLEELVNIEMFRNAPIYEGADEAIGLMHILREYGAKFSPYTLMPNKAELIEERNKLIKKLGFNGECYVDVEKPVLVEYDRVIEDCLDTCVNWLDYGFNGIIYIVDRPYNQTSETYNGNLVRVPSLLDAVREIASDVGVQC